LKKFKIIFATLIIFSSWFCGDIDNNSQNKRIEKFIKDKTLTTDDLNLKGNVRSFIEYGISPTDSFLNEGLILKDNYKYEFLSADTLIKKIWAGSIKNCYSIFFNIDGYALTKKRWFSMQGQSDTQNIYIYTYDDRNKLIKIKEYISHEQDVAEILREQNWKYENDKLVSFCRTGSNIGERNEVFTKLTYKGKEVYLESITKDIGFGKIISKTNQVINTNGEISNPVFEVKKEYDRSGNVTKIIEADTLHPKDILIRKFNYDKHDNLIQEVQLNEDNDLHFYTNYSYDENENLRLKDIGGAEYSEREIYNGNGQIIEYSKMSYRDSIVTNSITKYKYDELNNLVYKKMNYYDSQNYSNIIEDRYQLKYDDNKNWIEKRYYKGDSLTFIERRDILYY